MWHILSKYNREGNATHLFLLGSPIDAGAYSRYANYDWTPDTTDLRQHCGPFSSWSDYTSSDNLVGCSSPYPAHTYAWSEWESTDIEANGLGCKVDPDALLLPF